MWRGGALFGDRGAGETHLELLGVDGAGAVGVEEVEGLTDLLLLLLGQVAARGTLGASASATVSLRQRTAASARPADERCAGAVVRAATRSGAGGRGSGAGGSGTGGQHGCRSPLLCVVVEVGGLR